MNSYILTITAKRKNAKRHIKSRSASIEDLRRMMDNFNACYIVEIYDSKWNLIERREQ